MNMGTQHWLSAAFIQNKPTTHTHTQKKGTSSPSSLQELPLSSPLRRASCSAPGFGGSAPPCGSGPRPACSPGSPAPAAASPATQSDPRSAPSSSGWSDAGPLRIWICDDCTSQVIWIVSLSVPTHCSSWSATISPPWHEPPGTQWPLTRADKSIKED